MIKQTIPIKQCTVQLATDPALHPAVRSYHLRGAIGNLKADDRLFHQHQAGANTRYGYPLIQYKILNQKPWLIGLAQGAEALSGLNLLDAHLTLGQARYRITAQDAASSTVEFGWTIPHLLYEFQTPWMALNQKNYHRYHQLGDLADKKRFLERILAGNLLSVSKGVGYQVKHPIDVEFLELKEVNTRLKGNPMTGFRGAFCASFRIPEPWGIGKSTARGFGTIQQKTW